MAQDLLEDEYRLMEEEKYDLIAIWNQTPSNDRIPSIARYLSE